jgi:hypothetical protein
LSTAKPSAAFSPVLGEVHRRCLCREFVRGGSAGADEGNRLAQAVYGKCSLVLPSRCNLFHCCVGPSFAPSPVVALTRPPCHRLRRSPKSSRSTAYANVACARWLQGRRSALEAARQSLGLLSCGCFEIGVPIHMGIMRSRYERSFCPSRPVGSFAYAFADRRLLCSKHWCSQPRFGAVLDGGPAVARQIL